MSYSRWGFSSFYTYWLATDSDVREEQMFDICGFTTISYQDILDYDIDGVIDILKDRLVKMNEDFKKNPPDDGMKLFADSYTDEEWDELKGYIKEWVKDVKDEYDTPSQQYKDGKITLEDAFIEEV